jgi:hypothetical protein
MADRSTLFDDIDSMEPERFAHHLAPNAVMVFGNAEPINGRDAIHDAWGSFCEGVDGVRHEQVDTFSKGDRTVVEARVTYTRKDNREVTVPVVTIYRAPGELIDDYRIYIDLAPLFAD